MPRLKKKTFGTPKSILGLSRKLNRYYKRKQNVVDKALARPAVVAAAHEAQQLAWASLATEPPFIRIRMMMPFEADLERQDALLAHRRSEFAQRQRGRRPKLPKTAVNGRTRRDIVMDLGKRPALRHLSAKQLWPLFSEEMQALGIQIRLEEHGRDYRKDTYHWPDEYVTFGTFSNWVSAARCKSRDR